MKKKITLALSLVIITLACKKIAPPQPQDNELLDGPVEGLTKQQSDQFLKGDIAFNDDIFTPKNGLGPLFVATSCGGCHAGDGKGHPFVALTRFGQSDPSGNKYLAHGAPQLQNSAIPGYTPETLPDGVSSSKLVAPANTGLGFIDAVSDADILALADPDDADGDGISGTVNRVTVPSYCTLREGSNVQNGKHIGRFGKKGAAYDLLQQTANAYNQDMGVNSSFEPVDTYSKQEVEPEVSNLTVHNVVFYLKTLKAPIQRNEAKPDVQAGKQLFMASGCEKCHKPQLKTAVSPISALSQKTFYPYTDLLLHDMGPALNDNYTEGTAQTYEWKTPALWGLGLSKNSQGGGYFLMHDGRAKSIEQAILLHGGEAQNSKNNFEALPAADQQKLIKFLESL